MGSKILNFPGEKEEVLRKKITIALFSICLLASGALLEYFTWNNKSETSERLRNLKTDLQSIADEFPSVANNGQAELGKIQLAEKAFLMRVTRNTSRKIGLSTEEKTSLEKWLRDFALHSISKEEAKISSDIAEATLMARKVIEAQFLLVRNRLFVLSWYISGLVYLIIVYTLYKKGLTLLVGEPIFNVIDVGFISIIVQYTGGPKSLAQLLYTVSIVAAVYNYESAKSTSRSYAVLTSIPYLFALFFAYFWACAEGIIFRKYDLDTFLTPSILASTCVIVTYLLALYYKFFLIKEKKT